MISHSTGTYAIIGVSPLVNAPSKPNSSSTASSTSHIDTKSSIIVTTKSKIQVVDPIDGSIKNEWISKPGQDNEITLPVISMHSSKRLIMVKGNNNEISSFDTSVVVHLSDTDGIISIQSSPTKVISYPYSAFDGEISSFAAVMNDRVDLFTDNLELLDSALLPAPSASQTMNILHAEMTVLGKSRLIVVVQEFISNQASTNATASTKKKRKTATNNEEEQLQSLCISVFQVIYSSSGARGASLNAICHHQIEEKINVNANNDEKISRICLNIAMNKISVSGLSEDMKIWSLWDMQLKWESGNIVVSTPILRRKLVSRNKTINRFCSIDGSTLLVDIEKERCMWSVIFDVALSQETNQNKDEIDLIHFPHHEQSYLLSSKTSRVVSLSKKSIKTWTIEHIPCTSIASAIGMLNYERIGLSLVPLNTGVKEINDASKKPCIRMISALNVSKNNESEKETEQIKPMFDLLTSAKDESQEEFLQLIQNFDWKQYPMSLQAYDIVMDKIIELCTDKKFDKGVKGSSKDHIITPLKALTYLLRDKGCPARYLDKVVKILVDRQKIDTIYVVLRNYENIPESALGRVIQFALNKDNESVLEKFEDMSPESKTPWLTRLFSSSEAKKHQTQLLLILGALSKVGNYTLLSQALQDQLDVEQTIQLIHHIATLLEYIPDSSTENSRLCNNMQAFSLVSSLVGSRYSSIVSRSRWDKELRNSLKKLKEMCNSQVEFELSLKGFINHFVGLLEKNEKLIETLATSKPIADYQVETLRY